MTSGTWLAYCLLQNSSYLGLSAEAFSNRGEFYVQLCIKQIFFPKYMYCGRCEDTKLPKHRPLVPLETLQGVWDINMGTVDLTEDLEETFARVAAEGQARYPRAFQMAHVAKFRQLKESLKVVFSHHTISCNPPGLQLFMGNFCFSWISPVSYNADVLGTWLHLNWYCVLVFGQIGAVHHSAVGIWIQAQMPLK